MRNLLRVLIFISICLFNHLLFANDTIVYSNLDRNLTIGGRIGLLEDKSNELKFDQVALSKEFIRSHQDVPNLQISKSTFWAKFILKNGTEHDGLVLEIPFPTIDSVFLYSQSENGGYRVEASGEYEPVHSRKVEHQNFIFSLPIKHGEVKTYFVKIRASEQLQLPMTIGTNKTIYDTLLVSDLIFGIYAGIILVMALYNLFVFFVVRDTTYLYYVSYILLVGLTQACIQGYLLKFMGGLGDLDLGNLSMIIIPDLVGYSSIRVYKKLSSD